MSLTWWNRCNLEELNWKIHFSKLNNIFSNLHNWKYVSPEMIPSEDSVRSMSLLRIVQHSFSPQILTDPLQWDRDHCRSWQESWEPGRQDVGCVFVWDGETMTIPGRMSDRDKCPEEKQTCDDGDLGGGAGVQGRPLSGSFAWTLRSKREGNSPAESWRTDISQEGKVMRSKNSGLKMKEEKISKPRAREKKGLVPPQSLASSCKLSKVPWSFLGLSVCKNQSFSNLAAFWNSLGNFPSIDDLIGLGCSPGFGDFQQFPGDSIVHSSLRVLDWIICEVLSHHYHRRSRAVLAVTFSDLSQPRLPGLLWPQLLHVWSWPGFTYPFSYCYYSVTWLDGLLI